MCSKFSINPVRKLFWVVEQNLAAGVQSILLKPRVIRNREHFFRKFSN